MNNYNNFVQQKKSLNFHELLSLIAQKTGCQPKVYGCGYKLRCPAHDDKNPSFTMSEGDNSKILFHCFVGCSLEDVCASIGIKVKDLFPKEKVSYEE
jgi:hypothetical protein